MRAFAFEKPRNLRDDPVELEAAMLIQNEYFRWYEGTAKSQGLEFIEISMIPESQAIALVAKWRAEAGTGAQMLTDPAARPVGRPPVKPFILEAFNALHAQGTIDYSKSLTSQYPLIRQWLAAHCSSVETSDKKPSDDSIRVAAGAIFKAEKAKAEKQAAEKEAAEKAKAKADAAQD